jgi:hypothetical protein
MAKKSREEVRHETLKYIELALSEDDISKIEKHQLLGAYYTLVAQIQSANATERNTRYMFWTAIATGFAAFFSLCAAAATYLHK